MLEDKEDVIKFIDLMKINDNKSLFKGIVRIKENNKTTGWVNNITIASGREFALRKVFNNSLLNSSNELPQIKNTFFVNAFGVGRGGSVIDNEGNVILQGPDNCDKGLYEPIRINSTAYNWNGVNNVVKPINNFQNDKVSNIIDEISISEEFENCDTYYTVVRCNCFIEHGEPAFGSGPFKIDEMCLFVTDSEKSSNQKPIPFAHICFSPRFVEKESTLTIDWFILF